MQTKQMILFYITKVIPSIIQNEYAVIYKSGNPNLYLSIEKEYVGLKHIEKQIFTTEDFNILRVIPTQNKYRLQFKTKAMYFNKNSGEFNGKTFVDNDPRFLFDLKEEDNGILIMYDGMCVVDVGWEEARQNYHLDIFPCNSARKVYYGTRKVPMRMVHVIDRYEISGEWVAESEYWTNYR